jgi:hypothetical protein
LSLSIHTEEPVRSYVPSASGDREAVVLDGGYDTSTGGLISVSDASGVTIADITLRRPRYHAIHVTAGAKPANGMRIYNVHVADPGEQAIKINNAGQGFYTDGGEIACSHIELTQAGRQQVMTYESAGSYCYTGGVDAHGAEGWTVRDNFITGFWCSNAYLAEHGIHFWRGSRDTRIERNVIVDNARGIGLGLDATGRTFNDDPCPGVAQASHYGGLVINNFIAGVDPALFASPSGMDLGIGLSYACGATVAHNSVASLEAPYSSIEWRFTETDVRLYNNLVTHNLRERDGATAVQAGNIEGAAAADFVDLEGHDLHLASGSAAEGSGAPEGAAVAPEDIDGDARTQTPDVGADER